MIKLEKNQDVRMGFLGAMAPLDVKKILKASK